MSKYRDLDQMKKNISDLEKLERGYLGVGFLYAELITKHVYRKVCNEIMHAKNVTVAVWYYRLILLGIIKK